RVRLGPENRPDPRSVCGGGAAPPGKSPTALLTALEGEYVPKGVAPVNEDIKTGVVVIGRNEGERLRRCLESVCGRAALGVYVDSASTDRSAERARSLGAEVHELDPKIPFTAARARREGFELLLGLAPKVEFVQFVDGDCEVADGWLERAAAELQHLPEA